MDPRYPIGKFNFPATWSAADREGAIIALTELPAKLSASVAGLSDAQLDMPYRSGGWTVRQLVHHVADSHINAYCRLRFALCEPEPTIKPYNESDWAGLADAHTAPPAVSLALLGALHTRWVMLLRSLTPQQFSLAVMHPENGRMTIDHLTAMYGWHSKHHTAHVTEWRLREKIGG